MCMQDDYQDADLDALLQEYGAPLADDGYSARVLKRHSQQRLLRRGLLGASFLLGGIIAGSQLSKLAATFPKFSREQDTILPDVFVSLSLSDLSALTSWPALAAMMLGFSFLFWLASESLDGKI